MITTDLYHVIAIAIFLVHAAGIACAINAVMNTRTPQGAFAWSIALCLMPYVSIPAYLVFGRNKFMGYVSARRAKAENLAYIYGQVEAEAKKYADPPGDASHPYSVLENLAKIEFTGGNAVKVLVDGQETFAAIFAGISAAKRYVLIQFFIVHDDELGRALKSLLLEKAKEGIVVYFLFDEIGSHDLPKAYIRELRAAGVHIEAFKTTRGHRNRFQINFRNHRKIVVVDGEQAFIGGLNVGDEYMGRGARFGPWRDTHMRMEGPSAIVAQLTFVEDWHWSTGAVPQLSWEMRAAPKGSQRVLPIETGPADLLETCSLFFIQAINSAKKRIWITSPYFVPDAAIIAALQLAVMRGVEVRVIIPARADHIFVFLAAFSYFRDTLPFGVKLYRYEIGFMHQKVLLVDDEFAAVGTANFDNRSFRLNFEIIVAVVDETFAKSIEVMLLRDFERCRPVSLDEIDKRSRLFKLIVRIARLLAPIQ